jgi:hypothetical protein
MESYQEAMLAEANSTTFKASSLAKGPSSLLGLDALEPIMASMRSGQGSEGLGAAVSVSEEINSLLLPWVCGGGPASPLKLAIDIMEFATSSLKRMEQWRPHS